MKYVFVFLVLGLVLVTLFSGCVSESNTQDNLNVTNTTQDNTPFSDLKDNSNQSNTNNNNNIKPEWINLTAYDDSGQNEIVFYFTLSNEDQSVETVSDGVATVIIFDDFNNLIYKGTFNVSSKDFHYNEIGITKMKKLIWAGRISMQDMNKGFSSSGNLKLNFKTNDQINFDVSTSVYALPEFNDKELTAIYDSQFLKIAKDLNYVKKIPNHLRLTLDRIGLQTIFEYDKTVTYLRLDITVENIGHETISYYPNPKILTKDSKQLEDSYISSLDYKNSFDSGEISPDVIKAGAIFFEISDDFNMNNLKQLILNTDLTEYDVIYDGKNKGDTIKDGYNYVFKFDLSDLK